MGLAPNLLDKALEYARWGWPVFRCKARAKTPATLHGFKDATTDEARIRDLWGIDASSSIGIPTGRASGIVVLDVDPRNDGLATLQALIAEHGELPITVMVATGGGGYHHYFKYPGAQVKLPHSLGPGLDLQSDGKYVIVPPSVHESGQVYAFAGSAEELAVLPDWIISMATRIDPHGAPLRSGAPIPAGERNSTLASLAGSMRRRGMSFLAIEAALREENKARCDLPLPETEVRRIAESIGKYPPDPIAPRNEQSGETQAEIITRCLADVEAQPIDWLWPSRIAKGKVTLVAGNPGLGKSQITAGIAAIVTTGGAWPLDGTRCEPGDVLFFSAEDDPADTIRPRLEAAGADLSRVHFVDGILSGFRGNGSRHQRAFSLQSDLEALARKLAELKSVSMVIIDPITAYLGDTDSHKNAEVRALIAPLSELAARYNVAIIAVSHLNKAAGTQALLRVSGSLAFVAAARAAFLVAEDPQDKRRRLFLPLKNNIGPDSTGLAFRIEGARIWSNAGMLETSRVVWGSEAVSARADDVLAAASVGPKLSALEAAQAWLEGQLSQGPVAAAEIETLAGDEGHSVTTLRRAAKILRVEKMKDGMLGGWNWRLPKMLIEAEDEQQKT